eukprot:12272407-Alexandrium_andersonii.AAC.1
MSASLVGSEMCIRDSREVVLKFCELTAYLFGGDRQAMAQACERARHEGDPSKSCGETVRGVMGRACLIVERESTDLAELLIRPLLAHSQALEIGLPQNRPDLVQELEGQGAPWHSVVVSDSTLFCVRNKSDQKHPKYFSCAQAALEGMRNQPTILVHWGAKLEDLTREVLSAFAGYPSGLGPNGEQLDQNRQHSVVTMHSNKG